MNGRLHLTLDQIRQPMTHTFPAFVFATLLGAAIIPSATAQSITSTTAIRSRIDILKDIGAAEAKGDEEAVAKLYMFLDYVDTRDKNIKQAKEDYAQAAAHGKRWTPGIPTALRALQNLQSLDFGEQDYVGAVAAAQEALALSRDDPDHKPE